MWLKNLKQNKKVSKNLYKGIKFLCLLSIYRLDLSSHRKGENRC